MRILNRWGFAVKLGRHITARRGDYSAGTEAERATDFSEMVASEEVGAIGCIVGGFAASGILRFLEPKIFEYLKKKPKIFFGYSDFSLILNALFARGFISLHAPNLSGLNWRSLDSQKSLQLSLLGDLPSEIGPLFNWTPMKPGFVKGRLLVSNLESLVDLLGTPFDPLAGGDDDLILALEEVGENKSKIVRWLEKLAIHTRAARIKGIIIGRFTKIGETDYPVWGQKISVERIFLKVFGGRRDCSIASLPQFGHTEERRGWLKNLEKKRREKIDFFSLPCGVKVLFKVKSESCRLVFLEKAVF